MTRLSPLEIRAELVRRRITLQEIANECGVSQPSVTRVIYGHSRSQRIEKAVAGRLGLPVEAVFEKSRRASKAS